MFNGRRRERERKKGGGEENNIGLFIFEGENTDTARPGGWSFRTTQRPKRNKNFFGYMPRSGGMGPCAGRFLISSHSNIGAALIKRRNWGGGCPRQNCVTNKILNMRRPFTDALPRKCAAPCGAEISGALANPRRFAWRTLAGRACPSLASIGHFFFLRLVSLGLQSWNGSEPRIATETNTRSRGSRKLIGSERGVNFSSLARRPREAADFELLRAVASGRHRALKTKGQGGFWPVDFRF